MKATYEYSVLNEGHVYVHYSAEKSPKHSELGITDLIILIKKLRPERFRKL